MSNRSKRAREVRRSTRRSSVATRWRWCSTRSIRERSSEVARSLGVNEGTLGNWVNKERVERGEREGLTADERGELADLRAEVTQLRMERDLLKRSMAFWVKEDGAPRSALEPCGDERAPPPGRRSGLVKLRAA